MNLLLILIIIEKSDKINETMSMYVGVCITIETNTRTTSFTQNKLTSVLYKLIFKTLPPTTFKHSQNKLDLTGDGEMVLLLCIKRKTNPINIVNHVIISSV